MNHVPFAAEEASSEALRSLTSERVQLLERHEDIVSDGLLPSAKTADKVPSNAANGLKPLYVKSRIADQDRATAARDKLHKLLQEFALCAGATFAFDWERTRP